MPKQQNNYKNLRKQGRQYGVPGLDWIYPCGHFSQIKFVSTALNRPATQSTHATSISSCPPEQTSQTRWPGAANFPDGQSIQSSYASCATDSPRWSVMYVLAGHVWQFKWGRVVWFWYMLCEQIWQVKMVETNSFPRVQSLQLLMETCSLSIVPSSTM